MRNKKTNIVTPFHTVFQGSTLLICSRILCNPPPCQVTQGCRGYGQYIVVSLCHFLLTLFPCSGTGSPQAAVPPGDNHLLQRRLFPRLQGNFCSGAWSTSSTSSSDFVVPSVVSYSCCSLLLCLWGILTFLTHLFPEVPESWLLGSAMPCSGSVGAGWNSLCPAQFLLTGAALQPPC